jgi:uncharacterized membrane protein YgcG
MEQRPLRVGDNVDDYCPRERRITNHVIVALVGSAIRQTRCSACETEHVFKAGTQPRPRKKEEPAGVLVHAPNGAGGSNGHAAPHQAPVALAAGKGDEPRETEAAPEAGEPEADNRGNELWSGHRRLIRATLPKVEGNEPPPRAIPEFTMHQRNVRGAHAFRQGQPWHDRASDGMRGGRHGSSFGGGHGHGGGHGGGRGSHFGGHGNGSANGNGNGNGGENAGNGAGAAGPGPGNRPAGGRRRRRRGRKPGGPV